MKQKGLKSILAFLFVLCVAFGMQTNIVSAEENGETEVTVTTEDDLKTALNNEAITKIILAEDDLSIDESIEISRQLILDLNGKEILFGNSFSIISNGNLIVEDVTGNGNLVYMKGCSVLNGGQMSINGGTVFGSGKTTRISVEGNDSKLIVSGGTVNGGPKGIGISVSDGANVEIAGNADVTGYVGLFVGEGGNAIINGGDISTKYNRAVSVNGENAKLIINGGTITCDTTNNARAAFLGKGSIEFNDGIIKNVHGGSSRAVGLSGGTFTMNGGTIQSKSTTSSQAKQAVEISNLANFIMNGGSVESESLGITTSTDSGSFPNATITINAGTINAGTYALQGVGAFIIEPENAENVTVTGGTGIVSPDYGVNNDSIISGGIFSHDVSEYVAEDSKSIAFTPSEAADTTYYVGADADNVIEGAEAGDKITALKNIETLSVNEGVLVVNSIEDMSITVNGSEVVTGTDPVTATHNMTHHEAVAATCTEAGYNEYWTCSICGKMFSDAEGNTEITETASIPATGHKWSEPVWAWSEDHSSATATFTCENDASHVEILDVETSVITKPATCTEDGEKTYTAAVTFNGKVYNDTKTEVIAATGHSFGEWETVESPNCTDNGSQQRTCSVCGFTETEELDAEGHDWEADYTVDKAATCTEDGSRSIHCKNCDAVKDSTVIPATGHDWSEPVWTWSEDYSSAAATFTCANDTSHVETLTATPASEITKPATCTEDGEKTYTVTVKLGEKEYTDSKTATVEKTGHSFSDEWKSDETSHWHECDCGEKTEIENHTFEWIIDKEATVDEAGSKHEECVVCGYKKSAVEIPKKEKEPQNPTTDDGTKPVNTDETTSETTSKTTSKTTSDKTSDIPKTGDTVNMTLWIALIVLSGGLLGLTVGMERKKRK